MINEDAGQTVFFFSFSFDFFLSIIPKTLVFFSRLTINKDRLIT